MARRKGGFTDSEYKNRFIGIFPYIFWPLFFIAVILIAFRTEFELTIGNIEKETIINASEVAEDFYKYLSDVTLIVDTSTEAIDDMLAQGQTPADVQSYLERKSAHLTSIFSGDTKGIYGYVQGTYVDGDRWVPGEDYVPTERAWYIDALTGRGEKVLSEPYIDARTGKPVVTASKLLSDGESVIAIDIWVSRMQEMTEEVGDVDDDHDVMIMDDNGNIIAHSMTEEVGLNYREDEDHERRAFYDAWKSSKSHVFNVHFKGREYYICPKPISDNWIVMTITNTQPATRTLGRLLTGVLISAAIGLILTFVILRNISKQRLKVNSYSENIRSLANIYKSMHKIDLETYDFEEITCKDVRALAEIGDSNKNADKLIKTVMSKVTDDRSRDEVLEFVDLSKLDDLMGSSDTVSIEFLGYEHIWFRGRFIVSERSPSGRLKSVIWAVEQIDKEKRSRDKLRYLAEIDQLTKINNRGSGEDKIRKLLKTGDGGMFVLFDVDKFKRINDSFGHSVGDKVLIAIGRCMKKTFRDMDVILRLGGDEFAAFTPGICDAKAGNPIIQRLIDHIGRINISEMQGQKINVSIGVSFYLPNDTYTFEELYKQADSCTYASKKTDGISVSYYEN